MEPNTVLGEDRQELRGPAVGLRAVPNPYLQSFQVGRERTREATSDGVALVRIDLPERSVESWRRSGLVDTRPNLAQLITLLKDAYEGALRTVRVRAELERLVRQGELAGGREAWDGLRESFDDLAISADDARTNVDPAVARQIAAFDRALEDGKQRLATVVQVLGRRGDAADDVDADELLDELREHLRTLREQSRTVGQACHDASVRVAGVLCHALDDVMLFVPAEARPREAQASRRELPLTEKEPAPAQESREAASRSLNASADDENVSMPRSWAGKEHTRA